MKWWCLPYHADTSTCTTVPNIPQFPRWIKKQAFLIPVFVLVNTQYHNTLSFLQYLCVYYFLTGLYLTVYKTHLYQSVEVFHELFLTLHYLGASLLEGYHLIASIQLIFILWKSQCIDVSQSVSQCHPPNELALLRCGIAKKKTCAPLTIS